MNFSKKICIPLLIFILLATFFSITVFAASERGENTKAHTEESVTGDVNGDGKLSLSDILELQKHIANIAVISSEKLQAANLEGQNEISMTDVLRLQKRIAMLDPNQEPMVERIILDRSDATVQIGESIRLGVSVLPQGAQNQLLYFSSSNEEIAVVDQQGIVTGISAGKATILVYNDASGISSACTIQVAQPVESLQLNTQAIKWTVGTSGSFKPVVSPDDATDKTLVWSSSNEKVATVSKAGKLSALAPGKTVITCTTANGIKATCSVTVVQEVEKIKLNKTSATLNEKGQTLSLTASISPKNVTDNSLQWTTSNSKVATISANGVIKAVGNGTATISCKAGDGYGATAVCKVTVDTLTVGEKVVKEAKSYVGKLNYVWGGTSLQSGVDCSGFVCALYAQKGYDLWGYRTSLRYSGVGVSYANAKPGDIICYPGHVAIYIGNGQIVHAANSQSGVIISDVSWGGSITAVRRIA